MTESGAHRRFALLDRDGTIIIDKVYLADPGQIVFSPGAIEGLLLLKSADVGLVLVTNQSGIGRGYFTATTLDAVHDRLKTMLAEYNIVLDRIYYCPHAPEHKCGCRKPATGMVQDAMADLGFEAQDAVIIGDSDADMDLAAACNMQGIRVGKNPAAASGSRDFLQAAQLALRHFDATT